METENNLKSQDISIIISGAINKKETPKCLKSIRKFLPNAEIILSTWEGSDVDGLDYDKLVLSKDPGATIFETKENKTNSINRIIVSSQNGISKASRKYILRLRSDLILKNANILNLVDDLKKRNPKSSLFKQRIFAYEIFSIKYDTRKNLDQSMLFHVSDWCYFGLKEDLEELFNVAVVREPEFSQYFKFHDKKIKDIHSNRIWKMSPEQYITSENAKKIFPNLNFENYLDLTDENISISEDFIINNFRVFSPKKWGIQTLKNEYKNIKMFHNLPGYYYSQYEQLNDYKKFCDNSIILYKNNIIEYLYHIDNFAPLRKHVFRFLDKSLWRKPSEIISIIVYFIKFVLSLAKEITCKKK